MKDNDNILIHQQISIYRLACLLIVLTTITSCDWLSNSIKDYQYKGTSIGYSRCIERNKGKGLGDDVVEMLCRKQHEQSIRPAYEASGGYIWQFGTCYFKGWIQNKSDDTVITSLVITLRHEDNKDKSETPIEERLVIDGLWVEPRQGSDFSTSNLKFEPKQDRLKIDGKFLYSWSIIKIKGIRVKLE